MATPSTTSFRIVGFDPRWRGDFARLNLEWLRRWFVVEAFDEEVLGDPERHILAGGGRILFALQGEGDDARAVGTVALRHDGDGVYELTKMAVTATRQGGGIGRRLLDAAIAEFRRIGGRTLFLETHSSLKAAISLYERAGFEHRGRKPDSHYQRSDTYMVWRDPDGA